MTPLFDLISHARVFDLSQPYFPGIPHHPSHPPYTFGLVKKHGEYMRPGGVSSAAEAIAFGGHCGTHIDALCHFSRAGKLHGGHEVPALQSYSGGIAAQSIDTVAPILRRGVLLDIAGLHGGVLPEDFEIGPGHLEDAVRGQGVEVRAGDVVLLRTGWAAYWNDPAKFICEVRGPGPAIGAARWLSGRGIFAAGSDTLAFEKIPASEMPVHVHFLVDSGIHIMECLNVEELAAARVYEFLFIAAPLKFRGGTASPIRPLAVVEEAKSAA